MYTWFGDDRKQELARYRQLVKTSGVPLWNGECGEHHAAMIQSTVKMFEDPQYALSGWTFWTWKKVTNSFTPLCEIHPPASWKALVKWLSWPHWPTRKPTPAETRAAMAEFVAAARFGRNTVHPEVQAALIGNRPPTTTPATAAVRPAAEFVRANCQPVWKRGNKMIWNQRQRNGRFDILVGDGDGNGGVPLLPAWDGHRGASGVTPDGRWVLIETDYGTPRGQGYSEPGKGFHNDLELLDRQSHRLTRLTTGRYGTIWAKLHPRGDKVTWAEMKQHALESGHPVDYLLGVWDIHVADITADGKLAHERSWRNPAEKGFFETYGWYGSDKIMFASDAGVQPKSPLGAWLTTQLWTIPDSLPAGNSATRVSPSFPKPAGGRENAYHEFMHLAAEQTFREPGPWILTSICWDANKGMDLWRMRVDGSGRERLTFFNGTWNPAAKKWERTPGFPAPCYRIVGGLVIDPAEANVIHAGVTPDPNAKDIEYWRILVK